MEVLEAADGHTGAELARRELPDAILLDVMLPTHNGLQVAEDLAGDSATAAIPIIFLTALGEGARERGMALGARAYVTKPFDPAALGDLVERVVAAA